MAPHSAQKYTPGKWRDEVGVHLQGRSVAGSGWNLEVVREVIGGTLDADKLALELDHPEFALPSARAFLVLMALWWGGTSGKAFPLQALIQRSWSNVALQLRFLRFATAAVPEVFSFQAAQRKLSLPEQASARPISLSTGAQLFSESLPVCFVQRDQCLLSPVVRRSTSMLILRAVAAGVWRNALQSLRAIELEMCSEACVVNVQGNKVPPNEAWLCLDLLMLLSQLYDNGHAPAVHQILEAPQAHYPEVLVLATATALRCAYAIAISVTASLNSLSCRPPPHSFLELFVLSPATTHLP